MRAIFKSCLRLPIIICSLQLLSVVSGVEVNLSQSCQCLLKSFYLASRRLRSSGLHSCDMPLNSLDVMSAENYSLDTLVTYLDILLLYCIWTDAIYRLID